MVLYKLTERNWFLQDSQCMMREESWCVLDHSLPCLLTSGMIQMESNIAKHTSIDFQVMFFPIIVIKMA